MAVATHFDFKNKFTFTGKGVRCCWVCQGILKNAPSFMRRAGKEKSIAPFSRLEEETDGSQAGIMKTAEAFTHAGLYKATGL